MLCATMSASPELGGSAHEHTWGLLHACLVFYFLSFFSLFPFFTLHSPSCPSLNYRVHVHGLAWLGVAAQVLHGSDSDILWLQRDLGLYVVNMFDTGQVCVDVFS